MYQEISNRFPQSQLDGHHSFIHSCMSVCILAYMYVIVIIILYLIYYAKWSQLFESVLGHNYCPLNRLETMPMMFVPFLCMFFSITNHFSMNWVYFIITYVLKGLYCFVLNLTMNLLCSTLLLFISTRGDIPSSRYYPFLANWQHPIDISNIQYFFWFMSTVSCYKRKDSHWLCNEVRVQKRWKDWSYWIVNYFKGNIQPIRSIKLELSTLSLCSILRANLSTYK